MAVDRINKLQGKVEGYKELLIAQDEEINKLKKEKNAILYWNSS